MNTGFKMTVSFFSYRPMPAASFDKPIKTAPQHSDDIAHSIEMQKTAFPGPLYFGVKSGQHAFLGCLTVYSPAPMEYRVIQQSGLILADNTVIDLSLEKNEVQY